MTDKNLTDNEIVKALECCGDEQGLNWCVDCPYYNKENDLCQEDLHRDALDLINRQKAEKEALINGQETLQKYIAEQKAENERLKRKLVAYEPSVDSGLFSQMLLEQKEKAEAFEKKWKAEIKSEAYKEFAERLKEDAYDVVLFGEVVTIYTINELLKELVGEDDG
jgi:hypothetical protein